MCLMMAEEAGPELGWCPLGRPWVSVNRHVTDQTSLSMAPHRTTPGSEGPLSVICSSSASKHPGPSPKQRPPAGPGAVTKMMGNGDLCSVHGARFRGKVTWPCPRSSPDTDSMESWVSVGPPPFRGANRSSEELRASPSQWPSRCWVRELPQGLEAPEQGRQRGVGGRRHPARGRPQEGG